LDGCCRCCCSLAELFLTVFGFEELDALAEGRLPGLVGFELLGEGRDKSSDRDGQYGRLAGDFASTVALSARALTALANSGRTCMVGGSFLECLIQACHWTVSSAIDPRGASASAGPLG
jgi:hypothetical protein